jgi:glutamate synthase (NADPH/NADH)
LKSTNTPYIYLLLLLPGPSAIRTEPFTEQLFVGPRPETWDTKRFDLELYLAKQAITKVAYDEAEAAQNGKPPAMYVCSLSCQTIVYKGQLTAPQVPQYWVDLQDPRFASHFALVHSRFSTNTFPSWDRAHPMRMLCHNGEINTLRGNKNWMYAREAALSSPFLKQEEQQTNSNHSSLIFSPVCSDHYSDSGNLDACLELIAKASDRTLPEVVMMMMPEAWQHDARLDEEKRAFYEYNSCIMEPWDGPAMVAFADGRYLGCTLDRNGLRPHRYYVTDSIVVAASEVGVIPDIDPTSIKERGRLMPGKMFLVDFVRQGIVRDDELKSQIAAARPYRQWLQQNAMRLATHVRYDDVGRQPGSDHDGATTLSRLAQFGYSVETLDMLLVPMVDTAKEALGSMGTDTPVAVLSKQPQMIWNYFQQLFAQVTNPPMDSIREEVVMSMECPIGPETNLLQASAESASRLIVTNPILSPQEAEALVGLQVPGKWASLILDVTFAYPEMNLDQALSELCLKAEEAAKSGTYTCIVLTDANAGVQRLAIPSLIAVGAVHQSLLRARLRTRVALVIESGDAIEVHHMCLLIGYGADAVHPYMAYQAISHLLASNKVDSVDTMEDAVSRYLKSLSAGIKKVMGKIGISTVQSYKGAQIFEAVGLGPDLMQRCFAGTASRLRGINLDVIQMDTLRFHSQAWVSTLFLRNPRGGLISLPNPGDFHLRDGGEAHYNSPGVIVGIQRAAMDDDKQRYFEYAKEANEMVRKTALRGLFKFRQDPIPLVEVEPAKEIVRRFVTGAMSFGSISKEAHEALAIAMNSIGAKSNTGEGGESTERFSWRGPKGESKRSAIKQVASGRFGVTSNYLTNADEIQIKMAQGAKPGEGGELPGYKVSGEIPIVRKSTEGVGLISPPPHHDIYSIEDLAQLIFDLKSSNKRARISVKLVSEVGVGVVAAGVAKAKADHITVSGHDGGTGAAAWTGIKHAGLPWEMGLAETQQTLVLNGLRGRVVLQTDGQIKTGRDVAVAFLLGAEEVGFATAPLIALGCIMMRKCHLNTCPVGIATQDPELRAKFIGKPEYVVNFLFMVAEECRQYMAQMGFRTVREMVGRADYLEVDYEAFKDNPKLSMLDLSCLNTEATQFMKSLPFSILDPELPVAVASEEEQDHKLNDVLDLKIVAAAKPALEKGERVKVSLPISNQDRAVGAMLSNEISRRYGESGLPDGTIDVSLKGYAGQSFGAFLASGVILRLEGDANDFVGKGLSGGVVIVYPNREVKGKSENNMVIGNVALYGATYGRAFFRGLAGERFCVRNSGAVVVVEGCGDHGCEYMTGGRAVILGPTGRNFGAGMSGGIAYVLDEDGKFKSRCNPELIDFEALTLDDEAALRNDIAAFVRFTGSHVGQRVLDSWNKTRLVFVKVFPKDLKRVLQLKVGTPGFIIPKWFPLKPGTTSLPVSQPLPVGVVTGSSNSSKGLSRKTTSATTTSNNTVVVSNIGSVSDVEDLIGNGNVTGGGCLSNNLTAASDAIKEVPSSPMVIKRDGKPGKLNKLRGFVEYERNPEPYRDALARVKDWGEINTTFEERDPLERKRQAARCMDCGTPFCQTHEGCPINNLIPEWNELVFRDKWKEAYSRLAKTNNFPEFTGRVCPAPCEGSCVAGFIDDPVTIKNIEYAIVDRAWAEGWIIPQPPMKRTEFRVGIIGSGPAGLACADQLNKVFGHRVTVFERDDRIGGLLMYGIPNPKLDKGTVKRRVDIMAAEGVEFITGAHVGMDAKFQLAQMQRAFDVLVLCVGACQPRDLPVPGRNLKGIHFAMEFLSKNTRTLLDAGVEGVKGNSREGFISAYGKRVIVIGGGDTGADCIGTSLRHECKSIVNLELLPRPPEKRASNNPWPQWPLIFRTDYAHYEAKAVFGEDPRQYAVMTKLFKGDGNGNVTSLVVVSVEFVLDKGKRVMREIKGSEREIPCDLVVLALGFLGPEPSLVSGLPGLALDERSNIKAKHGLFKTNFDNVFAAGDCRRGQSLVVWAINEGRGAAERVNEFLSAQVGKGSAL